MNISLSGAAGIGLARASKDEADEGDEDEDDADGNDDDDEVVEKGEDLTFSRIPNKVSK
jgi:hypothetical protein